MSDHAITERIARLDAAWMDGLLTDNEYRNAVIAALAGTVLDLREDRP